jgi:hypothetical protein
MSKTKAVFSSAALSCAIPLATAFLLTGTTQFAQAAYPCGRGYTLQDGVCRPYQGPYVPNYGYYGPGPYYDYGPRYYRRYRGKPCPEGYTVQDGVCKPYRGPYRW